MSHAPIQQDRFYPGNAGFPALPAAGGIWLGLVLILAVGTVLRVAPLGGPAYTSDEAWELEASHYTFKQLWEMREGHYEPSLKFLVTRCWREWVGSEKEARMRLLSALSGSLALVLVFGLGRMLLDLRTALGGTFFLAISPLAVQYVITIRWYSLFAFYSVGALYFYLVALREGRWWSWTGYVLLRTLASYTNYYSGLVYVSELAFFLVEGRKMRRGAWRPWLLAQGCLLALYLPWLPVLLKQVAAVGQSFDRIGSPIPGAKAAYLVSTLVLGQTIYPWRYVVTVPAMLLALAATAWGLGKIFSERRRTLCFLLLFAVPQVLSLGGSFSAPHYYLQVLGPLFLVLAHGLLAVRRRWLAGTGVLLMSAVMGWGLVNLYTGREYHRLELRDSWREMAGFIRSRWEEGDVIFLQSRSLDWYLGNLPDKDFLTLAYCPQAFAGKRLLQQRVERGGIRNLWIVCSPLSGANSEYRLEEMVEEARSESASWAELRRVVKFDRDPEAEIKRRFLRRPFPEYRSLLYWYRVRSPSRSSPTPR